MKLIHRF